MNVTELCDTAAVVGEHGTRRSRLRLCFARPSHEEIHEGVVALAEVCRSEFGVRA